MNRWWFAIVLVFLFGAIFVSARPGVVLTTDGATYSGDVTTDANSVTIVIHGISTTIDKKNIVKLTYTGNVDQQFNENLARLAPDDVKGRVALGQWAVQNGRTDLAVITLQQARRIDPTDRPAAVALDNAERQIDLDRARHTTTTRRVASTRSTTMPASSFSASQPATVEAHAAVKPLPRRLLTDDEVNVIRQMEMFADDTAIHVKFENGVVQRYLSLPGSNAAEFKQLAVVEQAMAITSANDPQLSNDVRILTDPPSLIQFRQKFYPLVASSCGSLPCHGGGDAGNFGLFTGDSTNVVYTNFYILQKYEMAVDGVTYEMIDRTAPERSLLVQYMLPADAASVAHPPVAEFRPRFRSRTDPVFHQLLDWIGNSLKTIPPDYRIMVSPTLLQK